MWENGVKHIVAFFVVVAELSGLFMDVYRKLYSKSGPETQPWKLEL